LLNGGDAFEFIPDDIPEFLVIDMSLFSQLTINLGE
jgi:hypothetical protein